MLPRQEYSTNFVTPGGIESFILTCSLQLPILKIKVCIRIVAYYNSCSWNENDKNWQCAVQNQWCPTAFQCVYSRTISSLLIFLRNAALY